MAVRLPQLCPLLSKAGGDPELTIVKMEAAFQMSTYSRKSQQKFLHPRSTDTTINKGRRGQGGNTCSQHCYIFRQEEITEDDLSSIRKGELSYCYLILITPLLGLPTVLD